MALEREREREFALLIRDIEQINTDDDVNVDNTLQKFGDTVLKMSVETAKVFIKCVIDLTSPPSQASILSLFVDEIKDWEGNRVNHILQAIPLDQLSSGGIEVDEVIILKMKVATLYKSKGMVEKAETVINTIDFHPENQRKNLKAASYLLEVEDVESADYLVKELSIQKNEFVIKATKELKASQAAIEDRKRNFIEAAELYYDAFECSKTKEKHLLSNAAKCAILAIESQRRTGLISLMLQKRRCKDIKFYGTLLKVHQKMNVSEKELYIFTGELQPHQRRYFDTRVRGRAVGFFLEDKIEKEIEIEPKPFIQEAELKAMLYVSENTKKEIPSPASSENSKEEQTENAKEEIPPPTSENDKEIPPPGSENAKEEIPPPHYDPKRYRLFSRDEEKKP